MNGADSYKIILIGDSGTGKTSIINAYAHVSGDVLPTIGASNLTVEETSGGRKVCLRIWDTAGDEQYKSILPLYFRGAAVALCVFDITSQKSFDNLPDFVRLARAHCPDSAQIVVVGNKTDLEERRAVQCATAEQFSNEVNALFYHETSKSNAEQIEFLFARIADYLRQCGGEEEEAPEQTAVDVGGGAQRESKCCAH